MPSDTFSTMIHVVYQGQLQFRAMLKKFCPLRTPNTAVSSRYIRICQLCNINSTRQRYPRQVACTNRYAQDIATNRAYKSQIHRKHKRDTNISLAVIPKHFTSERISAVIFRHINSYQPTEITSVLDSAFVSPPRKMMFCWIILGSTRWLISRTDWVSVVQI